MSEPAAASAPGYVGRPVYRKEDRRLLTGRGCFVADVQPAGMLALAVVRSPHAAARIVRVDLTAARQHPHAAGAWAAADLPGVGPLPCMWVQAGQRGASYPVLAADVVRYVGQPVAAVVGANRYVAEDIRELVAVDYDALPAVTDARVARGASAASSPLLHPDWGTNVSFVNQVDWGDVDAAFSSAAKVVETPFYMQRISGVPMETRGCLAAWDPGLEELTLWTSTQNIHTLREIVAEVLGLPAARVRVRSQDVGGGFGVKLNAYPEEVLVGWAARATGRPVQWIEDRLEHFMATVHAREQHHRAAAAFAADGTLLALRDEIVVDIGAHPHARGPAPAASTIAALPGPYRLGACKVHLEGVVTNKVPNGMLRGVGKTQAALVRESLMDMGAAALGLDPAEIRRRNLVQPGDMPYRSPSGRVYDSGNYPACMALALSTLGYGERRLQQRQLRAEGRLYGIGIACYTEGTGQTTRNLARQGRSHGGYESVVLRLDGSGALTLWIGLNPGGQGHETVFAQVAADALGLDIAAVQVRHGDTATAPFSGHGTASSRGAAFAGAATLEACARLREKAFALAAHLLEADPADLELASGSIRLKGMPGGGLSWEELARTAMVAQKLPAGMEPGLEARATFDPERTGFSFGCMAVALEVDRQTGAIAWDGCVFADDCGNVINPMIVDGQLTGGAVAGFGNALLEHMAYDDAGQLLTATFLDYLLPTAADVPPVTVVHTHTPAPWIPGGVKGVGEAGAVPPPAAILNAVCDAIGVRITNLPLTPERILAALRSGPEPEVGRSD